jgi:hypothetical protein
MCAVRDVHFHRVLLTSPILFFPAFTECFSCRAPYLTFPSGSVRHYSASRNVDHCCRVRSSAAARTFLQLRHKLRQAWIVDSQRPHTFHLRMARLPFDVFLPSGAVEDASCMPVFGARSASISPLAVPPHSFSPYIPARSPGGRSASPKPYSSASSISRSSSLHQDRPNVSYASLTTVQHQNGRPLSPLLSRTSSGEDNHATQIQSWRIYTQHLRENAQGERAHMEADRARMEEVMAEERALWDQERELLKGRIVELETQLAAMSQHQSLQQGPLDPEISPGNGQSLQKTYQQPSHYSKMMASGPTGVNGNSARLIHQESGRNPDGSPFYAPAPRNPSRTFEASQNNGLRVDSMSAPRETPIRVTSKELSESDFGLRSPPAEIPSKGGGESIDISHLQPELEGVPIKASAVAPEFVAQVRSPNTSLSPSKPSSHVSSPPQRLDLIKGQNGLGRSSSQTKKSTLEVIAAPEIHRLTMNAGHTPNHSIHKLDLGDSGGATPTQDQHRLRNPSMAVGESEQHDENIDLDPELRGPLGLKNDPPKDELFLAALTNKLKEVKESGLISPREASLDNQDSNSVPHSIATNIVSENKPLPSVSGGVENDDDSKQDDVPLLKVKQSMNFGRPFGSL